MSTSAPLRYEWPESHVTCMRGERKERERKEEREREGRKEREREQERKGKN